MKILQEQTKGLTFWGISEKGESHQNRGLPNQDSVEFLSLDNFFVVAVSDGLGSCKLSHIGSSFATGICRQILLELIDEKIPFEPDCIAKRIDEIWKRKFPKIISKEYCATLKAVFANETEMIAVSIGDGSLIILSRDNIFMNDNADNFANQTKCLTNQINPDMFLVSKVERSADSVVIIMTDGVSSGITEGREIEFAEQIADINKTDKLIDNLKKLYKEMSKYNADDKTIAIVKCECLEER